jgi:GNAT superfamily N-acetyltransferase
MEHDMAQAEIIVAGDGLLHEIADIHNAVFRPRRGVDFFKRRFLGRYNCLNLLGRVGDRNVGFWTGFELKPGTFYHWLGAVLPEYRRQGVARQFHEAQGAWVREHGYESIRSECLNSQREFLHFALNTGFNIVGTRWDPSHADTLILLERTVVE